MSDSKKNAPKRRFEEFSNANDWEQRKLGELADIVGGGTPSTLNDEYWNGDIDWYFPAEIDDQIYVFGSQKKITQKGLEKSSAKILPVGSVLFTSRAGIGKTAILGKEGATNQGFQSILPYRDTLDSYVIFSLTHELKRYGEITGAGSTFVEVSGKQLTQMPILVPNLKEQQKIGTFFKQLDNTIALHQRKLEKIKALKTAYLSEMFPAEGESKPKRRFAGFTDDWEQRKLGEVLDNQYNGQTPSRENDTFWKGSINWLSSGELNRAVVSETIEKITKAGQVSANLKMISKGTFVLAITGLEAAGTRGNCAILGVDTTLNQSCMALFPNEKKLDPSFLFQWYRKVGEEYGIRYTQGTKQQSYNA
ncbi:restriction endonuclease subunit S, partial [Listeria seeligeri]|uniref:restriction endonuclease subunit S n=1 Tax=Listeria seeligeri TaxID=1640 RepID=UPI001623DC0E